MPRPSDVIVHHNRLRGRSEGDPHPGVYPSGDGLWVDYTPVLTASSSSPTLGTGSEQEGRYVQVGNLVVVHAYIKFGSSGTAAGSGTYFVSLPVDSTGGVWSFQPLGHGMVFESGASRYGVEARRSGASDVLLSHTNAASTSDVTHAVPFAWGAGDILSLNLTYEAA